MSFFEVNKNSPALAPLFLDAAVQTEDFDDPGLPRPNLEGLSSGPGSGQIAWESPLNKEGVSFSRKLILNPDSKAKRRLFFDEDKPIGEAADSSKIGYDTLSKWYGRNFQDPPLSCNAEEFFHVRELVLAIETLMSKEEGIDVSEVRKRIMNNLGMADYQTKMAELGLILFYLDRNLDVPQEDSLLKFRALQMQTEVETCLRAHKEVCDNPLIPSGKTHYLMRAFSHMVMTKSQVFNRGGLIAIKALLQNPCFPVSLYLQPEHRSHILIVIDQILGHRQFEALFQKRTGVHPGLQDAIRLDLKLAPEEPVHQAYIFWDLMMMLFSDIRQLSSPNCYAVSALIYGMENHLYKIASQTLEWLERGFVAIGLGNTIPIAPLLEKRLEYSQDLDQVPERGAARTLSPFVHISSTLNIESKQKAGEKEEVKLKFSLSSLLQDNGIPEHLPYAEKLYYAYKFNALVHMNLAVAELTYMNQGARSADPTQPHSLYKSRLIDEMLTALETGDRGRKRAISPAFRMHLRRRIGQRIWLEPCNEKVERENLNLSVRGRQIKGFKGDIRALEAVFERSLRIFSLKGGKYELIHSLSDLQQVIIEEIENSNIELSAGKINYHGIKRHLELACRSKAFRVAVSNYCSNAINRQGIDGKHLNWADLLLLRQTGGHEDDVLKMVYGIEVSTQQISECHTPYQFLERLLERLKFFDPNVFASAPKFLISTIGEHAWTLSTECWDILLQNRDNFYQFIQKSVFGPAKRRMASWIPHDTVKRIVERYTKDPQKREMILQHYQELGRISHSKFRNDFCDRIQFENIDEAEQIIEEEFSKIKLTKWLFGDILSHLAIKVEDEVFGRLFEALPKIPAMPCHFAGFLREALIKEQVAILEPYLIERAICKAASLPLSIKLGDLNWVDTYREDPFHPELEIVYSYIKTTPEYRIRSPQGFERVENSRFKLFLLHHPRVATHRGQW